MSRIYFKFLELNVLFSLMFLLPMTAMAGPQPVAVEIVGQVNSDAFEVEFMESVIREAIIAPYGNKCPYSKVRGSMLPMEGDVEYLLVLMFRPDVYLADVARVTLLDREVVQVEHNYQLKPDDTPPPEQEPECPDDTVEAFFTCPACDESPNAITNFQKVIAAAEAAGIKYKYFGDRAPDGPANRQVYYDYWSCPNLRYYSNTGHGTPGILIAEDGRVRAEELAQFDLSCKMMFFTSCTMYNSFEPYVVGDQAVNGGASFFTGGIGMISMGSGDCLFGCFWEAVFPKIGTDVDFEAEHATCKTSCRNRNNIGVTAPGPYPWAPECSPDDIAPEVELEAPDDGQVFVEGDEVTAVASATDNVKVAQVELFVDDESAGVVDEEPYEWSLDDLELGIHTLKAVARDSSGNEGQTGEIEITLEPEGDDDDDDDDNNDNNDDNNDNDSTDDDDDDDDNNDDNDDDSADDDDDDNDDNDDNNDDSSDDDDDNDNDDNDNDDNDDSGEDGDETAGSSCGCHQVGKTQSTGPLFGAIDLI